MLGLGAAGHFGHPVPDLLNFALADLAMTALVVAVAQIVLCRRGG